MSEKGVSGPLKKKKKNLDSLARDQNHFNPMGQLWMFKALPSSLRSYFIRVVLKLLFINLKCSKLDYKVLY